MRCGVVKQALWLGLVVAFVVLALSACGGGGGGSGEQTEEQAATTPEATTATAGAIPERLPAGEYTTKNFRPTLSFTVGEGWQFRVPDLRYAIDIGPGPESGIAFLNVRSIYDPSQSAQAIQRPAPADMVAWLQEHPYLDAEKPQPVTIGGVEGKQFDATPSKMPKNYPPNCPAPCVPLFPLMAGVDYGLFEGEKDRFIVLEGVEGKNVIIVVSTQTEERFDEFAPEAQEVLDTVEWEAA